MKMGVEYYIGIPFVVKSKDFVLFFKGIMTDDENDMKIRRTILVNCPHPSILILLLKLFRL